MKVVNGLQVDCLCSPYGRSVSRAEEKSSQEVW